MRSRTSFFQSALLLSGFFGCLQIRQHHDVVTGIQSATEATAPPPVPNGTPSACVGKEKFLEIVRALNDTTINEALQCRAAPLWSETTSLYGETPVVIGLETCEAYRKLLNGSQSLPKVAGLYNSGTNALSRLLELNLVHPDTHNSTGSSLEETPYSTVPWDKHRLAKYRDSFTLEQEKHVPKDLVLPLVIVRDPYRWMQSMCKVPYDVKWKRSTSHCPNLVVTALDRARLKSFATLSTPTATLAPPNSTTDEYPTLIDLYLDWYQQYLDAPYPRLLIRYEDLLLHAEQIVSAIANCTGMEEKQPFRYRVHAAKAHGKSANYLEALLKYSQENGRYGRMLREDLDYVERVIPEEFLRLFHYRHAPSGYVPPTPKTPMKRPTSSSSISYTMTKMLEDSALRSRWSAIADQKRKRLEQLRSRQRKG